MALISDKDLVAGYLLGDRHCVELLVNTYYKKVYSLALKVLSDESDAKDITQDTFIRILEKLSQFRYKSSLQTWILNIAYNLCMNKLNATKKLHFSINEVVDIPEELDTDDEIDNFTFEDLESSFTRLASDDQLYLELFYLNGCSIKDIAKITGRSETAAKTGLFRARTKLKQMVLAQKING